MSLSLFSVTTYDILISVAAGFLSLIVHLCTFATWLCSIGLESKSKDKENLSKLTIEICCSKFNLKSGYEKETNPQGF